MGSWDLDLTTKELTWSEAACNLFGISSRDPVSYDRLLSLLEPNDRQRIERAIRQALEAGIPFDLSYELMRTSGSTHWVRARGSVIRGQDGTPRYLSGVVFDVDEEKKLEQT